MPGAAFLRGDEVTLRTVEPDDYQFVVEHWNAPSVRHGVNGYEPRTWEDVASEMESDSNVYLLVCVNGRPVGLCWLFGISGVHGRGEVGYWIVERYRGEGYATAALELLVEYAFDERRLRKVLARVFEGNEASARVLQKVGFEQEGRLREHYYVDGEYLDATLYGLIEE